ncbi:hypothetical protein [Tenacibaculum aestuarii]|uniref:hypothetical protein n=1 Tax=Tenacibaculum aestuarii TaxID=362781 RepID=UPI0038B53701
MNSLTKFKLLIVLTLFFVSAQSQEKYNEEYQIAKINEALKGAFYSTKDLFRSELKIENNNLLVQTIRNRDNFAMTYTIPINKVDIESMNVGKDKTRYSVKKPKTYQINIKSVNKERVITHSAFKNSKYSALKIVINSKEKGNNIIDLIRTLVQNHN